MDGFNRCLGSNANRTWENKRSVMTLRWGLYGNGELRAEGEDGVMG